MSSKAADDLPTRMKSETRYHDLSARIILTIRILQILKDTNFPLDLLAGTSFWLRKCLIEVQPKQ